MTGARFDLRRRRRLVFTTSARQGGTDTESVAGPGATTTQLKSQAPQGFAAFGASTPVGWEEPDPDLTGSYGSAKLGELPRMALTEKSVELLVRARSLRTQQRVKNRCQQTPSDGSAPRQQS